MFSLEMIILKSPEEIEKMRESGRLTALVLAKLRKEIKPGVTTQHLEKLARQIMVQYKTNLGVLGYRGYPASICTSVNEEVVHGLPGKRKLLADDIISIDVSLRYDGYWADSAQTFMVEPNTKTAQGERARKLLETTRSALSLAIAQAKAGNYLSDISRAIQECVERENFSVIRAYAGHGIGKDLHEDPSIPGYLPLKYDPQLRVGMTLAIEVMTAEGSPEVRLLDDNWTAVTVDGKLSGHFEHTVAITPDGPEVLTQNG